MALAGFEVIQSSPQTTRRVGMLLMLYTSFLRLMFTQTSPHSSTVHVTSQSLVHNGTLKRHTAGTLHHIITQPRRNRSGISDNWTVKNICRSPLDMSLL